LGIRRWGLDELTRIKWLLKNVGIANYFVGIVTIVSTEVEAYAFIRGERKRWVSFGFQLFSARSPLNNSKLSKNSPKFKEKIF
jgi:hypothetical protein